MKRLPIYFVLVSAALLVAGAICAKNGANILLVINLMTSSLFFGFCAIHESRTDKTPEK